MQVRIETPEAYVHEGKRYTGSQSGSAAPVQPQVYIYTE